MLRPSKPPRQPSQRSAASALIFLCFSLLLVTGCARFHKEQKTYVYVAARQFFLRDRVAAVSNRVGVVTNGEALEVVERGKRFIKVRTPKGEIGWLEEHAVIDDKLYAQFQDLNKRHAQDPVIANGVLRDDRNLHILPGRNTDHFLLIPGNAKLQLLARGTVPKAAAPGFLPTLVPKASAPKPAAPNPATGGATKPSVPPAKSPVPSPAPVPAPAPAAPPPPVPMEDWWLVRDTSGNTGWLLAGSLDVDVPEEIGGYAEGQRIVGAYPIAKVMDSGVEHKSAKKGSTIKSEKAAEAAKAAAKAEEEAAAQAAPTEHTEYVTVLTPRGGLPYDFDQLRVFTWSLNHHRYETGYRLHGIQGYLPVKLGQETVNGQTYPTFTFQIASTSIGNPDVKVDPDTGITRPVAPRTLSFRLEGNLVRRTGADQNPIVLTHDPSDPKSSGKSKAAPKKKKH